MEAESQKSRKYSVGDLKPRRPWLAGVANLAPPVGHIYIGMPMRGVGLSLIGYLLGVGGLLFSLHSPGLASLVLMLFLGVGAYVMLIVDVVRIAKHRSKDYHLKGYNRWFIYLLVAVAAGTSGEATKAGIRAYFVQDYGIPSTAMAPALLVGDHIRTDKWAYKSRLPKRFEVVVLEYPKDPQKLLVKRIIGLPGETIAIRDKKVSVNGTELADPYGYFSENNDGNPSPAKDSFGPSTIPDRSYFVLGDNRDRSYDSRFWGTVDRDKIHGLVQLIYFSWDSENLSVRWDRIGQIVE